MFFLGLIIYGFHIKELELILVKLFLLFLDESGLRIPEDMAVMGFDNLTSSKYIEGGITTIANPYEDMLSVAVNILTKRTKNPQMSQQQIALRPNLVVRHTT